MVFDYNIDYIVNLGFKSYKDEKEIMSSQIPLKFYRSYLDHIKEIYKLNSDNLMNKIKLLTKSENSSDDPLLKLIASNLLISRDLIIKKLKLRYNNILIDSITAEINKKNSDLNTLKDKLDKFLTSTKNMNIKTKKILKKERTAILNKGLNPKILSAKINKYNLEISNLKNILALNKKELDNKIENLKKLSFDELFQTFSAFVPLGRGLAEPEPEKKDYEI
jgi:hypothetical protein